MFTEKPALYRVRCFLEIHNGNLFMQTMQIVLGKRIPNPDSPQQQSSITSLDSNSEASTSGSRKRKRSRRGGNWKGS